MISQLKDTMGTDGSHLQTATDGMNGEKNEVYKKVLALTEKKKKGHHHKKHNKKKHSKDSKKNHEHKEHKPKQEEGEKKLEHKQATQLKDNFDHDPDSVSEYDVTKKDKEDFQKEQQANENLAKKEASQRAEQASKNAE